MNKKIRWGVLGAASIAVKKVIPSAAESGSSEIYAIASRNPEKAAQTARSLGIDKAYGSYDALLEDSEIDAVYIPLPNDLHLKWTLRAAEAGKHVLCEKPIGLNTGEVRKIIEVRDRYNVKIQEAFMVRTHPAWLKVKKLIESGRIGNLSAVTGFFSYFNDDRSNIRNRLESGGGALYDIGCYCINIARVVFEDRPDRVSGLINRDPDTGVDSLTSAMLEFPAGQAAFTCSTQLVPYQRMHFFGTKGRIEVQIPFNIPLDSPTKIFVDDGSDLYGGNIETIEIEAANQYMIQFDLLSKAILENSNQPISLEDSFENAAVIDAVFRAAESGNWERVEQI